GCSPIDFGSPARVSPRTTPERTPAWTARSQTSTGPPARESERPTPPPRSEYARHHLCLGGGPMPNMTDYEATRRSFRLDVPRRFNAALDGVGQRARAEPGRLALRMVSADGDQADDYTFGDLRSRSNRMARVLAAEGVGKGDRVFVMLPRVIGWYDVLLGS